MTPEGGSWLQEGEQGQLRVKNEQLKILGHRYGSVDVVISSDANFGTRIVATRKVLSIA
jgi:hypothetical protein